jgi:hypothetical protein
MRILDVNGNEVQNPDLDLGYLTNDRIFIAHHEAIEAVKEVYHYETEREYPNGGRDVKKVVDVPAVEAKEAWDEYEDIQRYKLYTSEEYAEHHKYDNIPTTETRVSVLESTVSELTNMIATMMATTVPTEDPAIGTGSEKGTPLTTEPEADGTV